MSIYASETTYDHPFLSRIRNRLQEVGYVEKPDPISAQNVPYFLVYSCFASTLACSPVFLRYSIMRVRIEVTVKRLNGENSGIACFEI
jgi:hypothetical protein